MSFKDIMSRTQTTDFFIACKESRIESNTNFYGCFYLGPFDDSLTQTLANDLRRTLLSELTGLAITSIEIEGVLHKFSNLPGMKESVLDLICNLQNIVLKKQNISLTQITLRPTKKTYTGFLTVSGPKVVKARDLKLPAGLQCVDPNQYIVTLADNGFLNMKFNIHEGKNYIKQKSQNLDVNQYKYRNILLQNLASLNRATVASYNKGQLRSLAAVSLSSKGGEQTDMDVSNLSNPIPLDAVFMPVTKINCIVEENNIYSDFATDPVNFTNFQTRFASPKGAELITKRQYPSGEKFARACLFDFNSFVNTINYKQLYQSYLTLQNSTQTCSPPSGDNEPSRFASPEGERLSEAKWIEQSEILPPEGGSNDTLKLSPWESNNLYFNFSFKEDNLNLKNQNSDITTSTPHKFASGWESKSFSVVKNFLASKNINKEETLPITRSFLQAKKVRYTSLPLQALPEPINILLSSFPKGDNTYLSSPGESSSLNSKLTLIKTILKNQKTYKSFTTNLNTKPANLEKNLKLEYLKNLKLKPLRKKSHLIVEIWTNGSLHPRQALFDSFVFLSNNFIKLQTVKMIGSRFNTDLAYANLKYSIVNNYDEVKHNSKVSINSSSFPPNVVALSPIPQGDGEKGKGDKLDRKLNSLSSLSSSYGGRHLTSFNQTKNLTSLNNTFSNSLKLQVKTTKALQYNLPLVDPEGTDVRSEINITSFYSQNTLKAPIALLNISLRTYTALKKAGIFNLQDLINYSKNELLQLKTIRFAAQSLLEIELSLSEFGLSLKK